MIILNYLDMVEVKRFDLEGVVRDLLTLKFADFILKMYKN